jgi:hypothetical protein
MPVEPASAVINLRLSKTFAGPFGAVRPRRATIFRF